MSTLDELGRRPAAAMSRPILPLSEPPDESVGERRPTCRLHTLGCRVNQYETQQIEDALVRAGYRVAATGERVDLAVVNTCTVTAESDAKGRKLIRQIARRNPNVRTIVTGCYATREPHTLAELPGVAEVVADKRELPDLLARDGVLHTSPLDSEQLLPGGWDGRGLDRFASRQRAYVKVQDGCILRCTYCIIPTVRPGLRSRHPDDIADEVRRLLDAGHREIVLTGIHVGHYGVERTRGRSGLLPFRLWHLFRKLDAIGGDWRMRLSSIEAVEMNDEFVSAAADCERLCPQFHPALQSGSDTVLRRMRRRQSTGRFLERLQAIRSVRPDVTFTTDVLIGFPGETEAEFAETLDVCRTAGFIKLHVFPFSARRGTPAADLPNRVPIEVVRERHARLCELESELQRADRAARVGQRVRVLVERHSESESFGTDEHFIPVRLPGTQPTVGTLVDAEVTAVSKDGLEAVVRTGQTHPSADMIAGPHPR